MKQLHNEQISEQTVDRRFEEEKDLNSSTLECQKESEIEKGNLSDYLEIYGEVDDI